jgi:N-acetyl-anhydromuramyl-L-alanine amidase AmpD
MPEIKKIQFIRRKAKAFRKGRNLAIRNIVLHSTEGREAGDLATLTGKKVSVHWYVTRAGKVFHIVNDEDTAFHAGAVFKPNFFSNDATVGIEQEHFDPDPKKGRPNEDWPDKQIQKVAQLTAFLVKAHNLKIPDDIKTHEEIAKPKGRKQDPFGYPFEKFFELVESNLEFDWQTEEIAG